MIQSAEQLAREVNVTTACQVLNVPPSQLYRACQPKPIVLPIAAKSRAGFEHDRTRHRAGHSEQ